ncbi:hypothetical protein H7965_18630 [Siccirubricoccus deserti]|uniref:Uncharacterized protein n=1 Tax=Siccirubricoccus deserti TaxID=2013562 RepID=A0A9X0R2P9_9PROT|nr:hypothetical protein [Siccirubricoccus deserti]
MTCIAFAYLQHLRLAGQRPTGLGENVAPSSRTTTIAQSAVRRAIMTRLFANLANRVTALPVQTQATT